MVVYLRCKQLESALRWLSIVLLSCWQETASCFPNSIAFYLTSTVPKWIILIPLEQMRTTFRMFEKQACDLDISNNMSIEFRSVLKIAAIKSIKNSFPFFGVKPTVTSAYPMWKSGFSLFFFPHSKIRKLFHGHPDLINDFHTFLPPNPHSNSNSNPNPQPSTVSTVSTVSTISTNPPIASIPAVNPVVSAPASLYAPYPKFPAVNPPSFPAKTPAKPIPAVLPPDTPEIPAGSDQDIADFASLRSSAGLIRFEHFLRICALFADVALSHTFESQKVISLAEFVALCESLFRHKPHILQQISSMLLRCGVPRDLVKSPRFLEW